MSDKQLKQYQGYVHVNGTIQTKRMIPELGLEIDCSSPFIKKYLGVVLAGDYEDAKNQLEEKALKESPND